MSNDGSYTDLLLLYIIYVSISIMTNNINVYIKHFNHTHNYSVFFQLTVSHSRVNQSQNKLIYPVCYEIYMIKIYQFYLFNV